MVDQTISYRYNDNFQVDSITYANRQQTITYNQDNQPTAIGDYRLQRSNKDRVTTITDSTNPSYYQTTTSNRYGELQTIKDNTLSIKLTRDKAGEITKKVEKFNNKKSKYRYSYGTMGQLLEVETPTKTITYLHNANNPRVAKLVDGTITEKYLWANLTTLLAIYDKDDTLLQRYEYADSRMPIAMIDANKTKYYLHYDQVGTLRAVTDTNHNTIKEVTYDTFGNILSDSNPSFKVPFGFAGGLYDSDTKLTRFGYRDYDAYTGKWTAKDPIGFAGRDSSLYGYVLGDPVGLVDPEGKIAIPLILPVLMIGGTTWAIYEAIPHAKNLGSQVEIAITDWWDHYGIEKLKKGGVHPHDLKENARQDLYKDKNGNISVKRKGGKGPGEPTGLNINDF